MRIVALLVLLSLQTGPLSVAEYRERLGSIRSAIELKDVDAVRAAARDLQALRVRHQGTEFAPDPTVLGPLAEAQDAAALKEMTGRLEALLAGLESISGGPAPRPPDGALLERLRQEEAERRLSPGGAVGGPGLHAPQIPKSFRERLSDLIEDLLRRMGRFLTWLLRFLFGSGGSAAPGSTTPFLVAALVVTVLGVLGIVAIVALRRRQAAGAAEALSEAPARRSEDEDPLSRTASEWERYAAELMKSGRFREAIRAWYHAVLVTLFRAGALHYRKDRTNWEYAYALPSTAAWRPEFVEATRTFEREWYGRHSTEPETAEAYQQRARTILTVVREGGPR
jgi:hypothetical protein